MMNCAVLFVVVCMTTGVPVKGYTIECRHCNGVRDPTECKHYQNCKENCVTAVQLVQGEYLFSYFCGHLRDCSNDSYHHIHLEGPVVCRQCCSNTGCDQHTCSQYFKSALTTSTPTTTTSTTTTTPTPTLTTTTPTTTTTTPTTTPTTTTTTTMATTKGPIVSKGCNNLDVLTGLAKGSSVSHPGTPVCSDGAHQPSEALIQEYCGAPSKTAWMPGVKVIDNCPNVPSYTAIAALTTVFGGTTVAAVFLKCEVGGFQAAIQTCGSELRLHHVSTNSSGDIPSADKFVLLDWKN